MICNELISKLVEENEQDPNSLQYERLVSEITSGKEEFNRLVAALEVPLKSPDLDLHIRGLNVLGNIIQLIPKDFFSPEELEFIVNFFCAQLNQHHSFCPVSLKILHNLVQIPQVSDKSLHKLMTTLFTFASWQTQTISDRKVLYQILQHVIFNRVNDFASNSSEFLFNVISAVDGEQDPRNILLLFSFLPRLYNSLPLGVLAEDAFEAISCYFPIDFHPTDTDPGVVTRDDLVTALYPCLLAVPEFTTYCIQLIEEKLESHLKTAKLDCYKLFVEGCKSWPPEMIKPHVDNVWLAIKRDTLPPTDTQIANAAVQALQSLVEALPEDVQTPLLVSVLHSCRGYLTDVQLSLFEPSARLLLAAMQGSSFACYFLADKLLPGFISLLQVTPGISKLLVINNLTSFIEVCLTKNVSLGEGAGSLCKELCKNTESGDPQVQQAAYFALTQLVTQMGAESRTSFYSHLLAHAVALQSPPVRLACLKCLQKLALNFGDEVESNFVNKITFNSVDVPDLRLKRNKFEIVCSLAVVERFHQNIEHQFLRLVGQDTASLSVAILGLRNLLEEDEVQKNNSLIQFLFFKSSVLHVLVNKDLSETDLLNSARIIQILVRLQTSSDQERVVQPLVDSVLKFSEDTKKLVLLESLISPLWPEVTLQNFEEISLVVVSAALQPSDSSVHQRAAHHLLSSLINKSSNDDLLEFVSKKLSSYSAKETMTAQAYIAKALVLRRHPQMEHWINRLVDSLDSEEIGEMAAESIKIIVEESEECLNIQNHCHVRLLYRQQLFHHIVPKLVHACRVPHLKALASLLQAVPQMVYTQHIKQIIPLLIKSLDTNCEELLCTILPTLSNILFTNHSFLEDHADTFIPRFINLAIQGKSMKVRIPALQCLSNSLKFSHILLLPYKRQVVSDLLPCLDDKKRLVRREAARTRAKWFLLDSPTDKIL